MPLMISNLCSKIPSVYGLSSVSTAVYVTPSTPFCKREREREHVSDST